jgi:hypothetical protein
MPSLRVATWNIAGARREQTHQVDLLAVQEVDRTLARRGRADQPAVIARRWVPTGTGPNGSRRIVWMIMGHPMQNRGGKASDSAMGAPGLYRTPVAVFVLGR